MDAMVEVQTGGHFLGTAHMTGRYQTELHEPPVADFANIGMWQERGSIDTDDPRNRYPAGHTARLCAADGRR